MKHLGATLLLALLAALAGAQEARPGRSAKPTDDEKVLYSQTAEADLQTLRVFDEVDLTSDEALQTLSLVREYHPKALVFAQRRTRLLQAALPDLQAEKEALLRNQRPAAELRQRLAQLATNLDQVDQEQLDAGAKLAKSARDVLSVERQKAILAPGQVPKVSTADQLAQARRDQAAREQAVLQDYLRLIHDARQERDPRRFRELAPTASTERAVALTGVAATDPLMVQLIQLILDRLTLCYLLPPAESRPVGYAAAIDMTRATLYVIAQHNPAGIDPTVTFDEWQAALTYDRAADLLDQLARYRLNPFARTK